MTELAEDKAKEEKQLKEMQGKIGTARAGLTTLHDRLLKQIEEVFAEFSQKLQASGSLITNFTRKIDGLVISEQSKKAKVQNKQGAIYGDVGILYTMVKAIKFMQEKSQDFKADEKLLKFIRDQLEPLIKKVKIIN